MRGWVQISCSDGLLGVEGAAVGDGSWVEAATCPEALVTERSVDDVQRRASDARESPTVPYRAPDVTGCVFVVSDRSHIG